MARTVRSHIFKRLINSKLGFQDFVYFVLGVVAVCTEYVKEGDFIHSSFISVMFYLFMITKVERKSSLLLKVCFFVNYF